MKMICGNISDRQTIIATTDDDGEQRNNYMLAFSLEEKKGAMKGGEKQKNKRELKENRIMGKKGMADGDGNPRRSGRRQRGEGVESDF
jgi:hypothetical protein